MFERKLTKRVGWFSVVAFLASGCAAIVGADGYEVTSSGSGGSTSSGGGGRSGGPVGGIGGANGGSAGATAGSSGGGTAGSGGATGGTGGVPPTGGSGGTGGAVDGGAGKGGSTPDSGPTASSGEITCTSNTCPTGLACQTPTYGPPGLCVSGCAIQGDCDAQHFCASDTAYNFPASCLKKCTVANSAACGAGLVCVPQTVDIGALCLPLGWVDGLGTGDDCVVDAQCTSGSCRNKPNGWCTKPCGMADPLCAHDATTFGNRHGELNWCVTTGGTLTCVPGCDVDMTVCQTYYPGTTCRSITDITGSAQYACLP